MILILVLKIIMVTARIYPSTTNLFWTIVICGTFRFSGNHTHICCAAYNPVLQRLNMTINFTKLSIAVIHDPPFSIVEKQGNKTVISGYDPDLVISLLNFMNIKYDIYVEESNRYGSLTNGSWTGLVSHLAEQRADLLLPTMSFTANRHEVADFTLPLATALVSVVYRRPNHHKAEFNILPHVQIHRNTYLSLGLLILVTSSLLAATSKLTPNQHSQEIPHNVGNHGIPDRSYFLHWATFFYACVCNATGQGNLNYFPRFISGKIIVSSYALAMMLIITWFSSMITSRAAVTTMDTEIKSLRTLIAKNSMKITCLRDSSVIEDMKAAKSPDILELLSRNMLEDNLVTTVEEGLHKVIHDNFIFVVTYDGLIIEDKIKCQLVFAREFFRRRYYRIAVRKNSTLLPILNEMIRKIREGGVLYRVHKKYLDESIGSSNTMCDPSANKVTLQHTLFSFVILLTGIVVALIICIIEIIFNDTVKTLQKFCLKIH